MSEIETKQHLLPVALEQAGSRPSFASFAPSAAFVSQLIVGRDRLPPQRDRRMANVDRAVGAYRTGAGIAVKRMPEGYRKTVVA